MKKKLTQESIYEEENLLKNFGALLEEVRHYQCHSKEKNLNTDDIIKHLTIKIKFLARQINSSTLMSEILIKENESWRNKYSNLKNFFLENLENDKGDDNNPILKGEEYERELDEKVDNLTTEKQKLKLYLKEKESILKELKKKQGQEKSWSENDYKKEIQRINLEINKEKKNIFNKNILEEKYETLLNEKKKSEHKLLKKLEETQNEFHSKQKSSSNLGKKPNPKKK